MVGPASSTVVGCVFENNTSLDGSSGGAYLQATEDEPANQGYSDCSADVGLSSYQCVCKAGGRGCGEGGEEGG